jgi:hypothetical protein
MSSPRFEAFLARLYSEAAFLDRFLAAPESAMSEAGLDAREREAAIAIERVGLQMAARSYAAKRSARVCGARRGGMLGVWLSNLRRRLRRP